VVPLFVSVAFGLSAIDTVCASFLSRRPPPPERPGARLRFQYGDRVVESTAPQTARQRRALVGGCLRNAVEWYDFGIYGAFPLTSPH
jgi:hypothetical protein